jgi:CheY-like chemotaxis protein
MKSVLIIEDNKANMKLACEILTKAGYSVHQAFNSEQAFQHAIDQKIDLIVLDIGLPHVDGTTIARIFRTAQKTKDIPIMALTAHAMSADKERILNSGCDSYMSKPLRYKKFLSEVQKLTTAR